MSRRGIRTVLVAQAAMVLLGGSAAAAQAAPASGPRETVDQSYTTTRPGAPTGLGYTGSYHAAGDTKGNPPYMRRMDFVPPRGFRFDTSAPDGCTAPDIELEARGPAACPAGSVIGEGTTSGIFFAPITHSFVFDRYKHHVDILNNTSEQIVLVKSEGYTVVRGRIRPDQSLEFDPPTCFPVPPAGGCVDDYVLQLGSTTLMPAYTKTSGGVTRSYATTPQNRPRSHYWQTTISFWWADGSTDTLASREPCHPR